MGLVNRLPNGFDRSTLNHATGWLSGGEISINADNTRYDVSAGSGIIVDFSDPLFPAYKFVEWKAKTAVIPQHVANFATTFIFINSIGEIAESPIFPDSPVIRQEIAIGSIIHPNNINITGVSQFLTAPVFGTANNLNDLQVALGVINKTGNDFSGHVASLSIDKDIGSIFYLGINTKTDTENPNNLTTPALSAPTVVFSWRDGAGSFNTTASNVITASVYDGNGGGVTAPTDALSTNQWINSRIYYSPDANQIAIEYGQTFYNSDTGAIVGAKLEAFEGNPSFVGIPLRCIMTHRGGAVDLSLVGDASFDNLNKLGLL